MNNLTAEELLVIIKDLVQKHSITAYEIGENTSLNTSGVHRILNGEVPKPRIKTLKIILGYIEDKLVGDGSTNKKTRESVEDYLVESQNSIEKIIALEVLEALEPRLAEFKEYHNSIMRALASQALDLEDFRSYLEKKNTGSNSNKN